MRNLSVPFLFTLLFFSSCYDQFSSSYNGNFDDNKHQNGDNYSTYIENDFLKVSEQPISTFSTDADGASYSNTRRYITQQNALPPAGAVRTEEFINYFELDYPHDNHDHPISLNGEVSSCPWNQDHKLIRIGIKGKDKDRSSLPPSNFVLLIDVSGSMNSSDKLELLKTGFLKFVDEMDTEDRIAIVTYASNPGVYLKSTSGKHKDEIKNAIKSLDSGGSTNGEGGINTAYDIAIDNFIQGGNNRIIIGTDGDFNVGVRGDDLKELIEKKRDEGVFLTVLGVGRGNYQDGPLEAMANNGNGTFEYIDKVDQLDKVFIHDFKKFYAAAKDVKVQITFNADIVSEYRLIGYENRILETEDFEDDRKDAGDIGINQNVTALYEIIPTNNALDFREDPTFEINFRYKMPDSDISQPLDLDIYDTGIQFSESSDFMKFTAAIATYCGQLIYSKHFGNAEIHKAEKWISETNLSDPHGYKAELKEMMIKTRLLRQ